jgi:hypothetical protein
MLFLITVVFVSVASFCAKVENEAHSMVLTILRATCVVTLIEENQVGGICRWYYRYSVVLPTKTLKALVWFILPISKEASSRSIFYRVWCDVSSGTCLAGLSALLHKENFALFYSRVLRVV